MKPFRVRVFGVGRAGMVHTRNYRENIPDARLVARSRISNIQGMYADREATEKDIQEGDPLVYEVYQYDMAFEEGQLLVVTSIIHPGKVGDEYYMTKGHFHQKEHTVEVYVGLQVRGIPPNGV